MSGHQRRDTHQPPAVKKTNVSSVFLKGAILSTISFLLPPGCFAATTTSRDAYARIDNQAGSLVIGTSSVEERIQLTHGAYSLRSFQNRVTHQEYVSDATKSEEFRVTVNGTATSGASGEWSWVNGSSKVEGQGELEAVIHLRGKLLEVEKHYVIYPGTSIIRQWVVFKNRSDSEVTIVNPYLLDQRIVTNGTTPQTLSYMTGGGSFSGSQVLKQVAFSASYARSFDTKDKAEVQSVEGIEFDHSGAYGSGRYMPWFCISDADSKGGLFVGLDYYGHWAAEMGNFQGAAGYLGLRLAGYEKRLKSGETIETPKSLTGLYAGDLDAMGNELKAWQYRYLWDYTNNDYFSKIRYAAEMRWQPSKGFEWGGGTVDNWDYRLQAMFHTADLMHYLGADILWQDAGWHDYLGDNDGPDFMQVNRYLKKSGMRLAVWWPLWYAEKKSKVLKQHPDWGEGGVFRGPLDPSRAEVVDWMSNQLNEKAASWGDFQWREDGSAVAPVGQDETPMLSQYNNILEMQKRFRKRHPGSSIDLCSGGGNLMSFEGLRLADVGQLTDGGSLVFGSYYSSYLFPPDKLDDWTRTQNATWTNVATTLTMAPAWMGERGLYGHEQGILLDSGKENLRKTFETYHYLVRQGVAGRWVQIYHPKIEGDDPIYYLERLSRDKHRGAIVLKHFISGQFRIYPKGLNPAELYDVRFENAKTTARRTGQDLARNGITMINPQPGELIYLGLPNHPGSGTDSVPPTAPSQVKKSLGTNFGVTGVELQWAASTDNNWISYYQIYRDGEPIDRVATGLFFFDHTDRAALGSTYEVQAVDGDGNASAKVAGQQGSAAATVIYTALGGFLAGKDYSYQGVHGWRYEEWNGARKSSATWNGALGQMGLYEGTPGEHQVLIGGSWMRPGDKADAVRVFTLPMSGQVTITGNVHKDLYHTAGDGVRVKVLKGDQQIWPSEGWETIAPADTKGKDLEKNLSVEAGEKLYFVVNHIGDAADDETVWNPQVAYQTPAQGLRPQISQSMDDLDHAIEYSGSGWQRKGTPPWSKGAGLGEDIGYLQDRYAGTLSVSGTGGDKMRLKFRGTAVHLIGDTGSDRGIAGIKVDGNDMGSIDTFVPENYPNFTVASSSSVREPNNVALTPAIVLWGTSGLTEGEHTLEVTVSGRKNQESTGTYVGLDEVVITGSTKPAPMPR
jgi:hypothetical protein